ncbi:hypothetical protein F5B20DRAFT_539873 [Whalleya microplaca]|nr:hypothetical protein F5B20DRAFT_539873 [Whalleya microplaca]
MRSLTLFTNIMAAATLTRGQSVVLEYNVCPCSVDVFTCADEDYSTYQIPNANDGECYDLLGGGSTSAYVLNTATCTLYSETGCAGDEVVYTGDDSGDTYTCNDVSFGTALSANCTRL